MHDSQKRALLSVISFMHVLHKKLKLHAVENNYQDTIELKSFSGSWRTCTDLEL